MTLLTFPFIYQTGINEADIIGYSPMALALLGGLFGVKSFRDVVTSGSAAECTCLSGGRDHHVGVGWSFQPKTAASLLARTRSAWPPSPC